MKKEAMQKLGDLLTKMMVPQDEKDEKDEKEEYEDCPECEGKGCKSCEKSEFPKDDMKSLIMIRIKGKPVNESDK